MQCEKCLLSRQVISENGSHPVCCLPEDEARECILGEATHFVARPSEYRVVCNPITGIGPEGLNFKGEEDIYAYIRGIPIRCREFKECHGRIPVVTLNEAEETMKKLEESLKEYIRVTGKPPEIIDTSVQVCWQIVNYIEFMGKKSDENS